MADEIGGDSVSWKTMLSILSCVCSLAFSGETDPSQGYDSNGSPKVSIALTGFDVNDTNLKLAFRIKNTSETETWVCSDINTYMPGDYDQFFVEETRTFVIRRRQDVPLAFRYPFHPTARYIRLSPGDKVSESLVVDLPVHNRVILSGGPTKKTGTDRATHLTLEIGYYAGDLPDTIRSILEEAEKYTGTITLENLPLLEEYFPGVVLNSELGGASGFFGFLNKDYMDTGELFINYPWRTLKGEQVLRLTIDGVDIPYKSN